MALLGNRIFVVPDDIETKTAGGIILLQTTYEERNTGTVESVGVDGKQSLIGRSIMFNHIAAKDFEYNGKKGKVIFAVDLVATLN